MQGEQGFELDQLLRVMERLRDPDHGCPWDIAQDFHTIVPSTLEEAYELADAIEHGDFDHVAEELGDLLFQVVFYAQMGSERGYFDFRTIVDTLARKLIRRHPHVFANGELEGVADFAADIDSVSDTWESIKRKERLARSQNSILADIPLALPALTRAQKLQKRAARVGFDWEDSSGVLLKLEEEAAEFVEATKQEPDRREEELGDILFTCVNLARHEGIDAEAALRRASRRFEDRFQHMESAARELGKTLEQLDADSFDKLWRQAKEQA